MILLILFLFQFGGETESIESYLKEKLSEYSSYSYEVVSLPMGIKSPNDSRIRINDSDGFILKSSFAYVPIEIIGPNGRATRSKITLKLKLYQTVLIANRKIRRHEKLNISDFVLEEKEISKLRSEEFKDINNLNLYRASLTIKEGGIITKNMIERIPTIKIGDKVNAILESGSVKVSFNATARGEGFTGGKIRVIRDDHKMFSAEIIDEYNVKIIK